MQFVIGDRCADLFIYWPLARGLKDDQNKDSGLLIPKVFSLFKASRYRKGHDLSARSGSRERSVSVHQKTRFFAGLRKISSFRHSTEFVSSVGCLLAAEEQPKG